MKYINKLLCYIGLMNCDVIDGQISLEYHGETIDLSGMNSYDVANYIIAFSNFAGVISKQAYGEKIKLDTSIRGFRGDSFDIDFILHVSGIAAGIFTSTSPLSINDFIELIKDSITAWIHLNGTAPKSINRTDINDNHNVFQLENQNGQMLYVTDSVINVITSPRAGEAAEQFIKKPLESGLHSVKIRSPHINEPVVIDQVDAPSFIMIDMEKHISENIVKMGLLIESATFKEGNKWRFSDGQNSFFADIIDEDFLRRIDSGSERFGKGDMLIAEVRFTQSSSNGSLKMERAIIKVIDHQIFQKQDKLFH